MGIDGTASSLPGGGADGEGGGRGARRAGTQPAFPPRWLSWRGWRWEREWMSEAACIVRPMRTIAVSKWRRPFVAARAKELRRDQTPAEALLWEELRRRRFPGHRFRRQHPMGGYIADFFCHSLRLVVEIDGAVHDLQQGYDAGRDAWFRAQGYTVLRFRNEKVLGDLEGVMQVIRERLEQDCPEARGNRARACIEGDR